MKVLFVSSGNSESGINIIVKNQGESLRKAKIEIEYFTIIGKGLKSYLKHIFYLHKHFKRNNYNVVHAHYSFSAITATLAGCKPLVVSLMGSDIYSTVIWKTLIRYFNRFFWDSTIVKSRRMLDQIKLSDCNIIPNGVNLDHFKPLIRLEAKKQLGLEENVNYILFAANPQRPEKNFVLARKSIEYLGIDNIELLIATNLPYSIMPLYFNAAVVLLLTSQYEGSVNVVKEALACNLPVVSTDVGDVKENLESVTGCFICQAEPKEIANGLAKALKSGSATNGREKILNIGLDSTTIAKRIINIYEQFIN